MSDPNTPNIQTETRHFNLNPQPEPPGVQAMSTGETLTSIFFEPGRVFESFRTRPRFLVAGLIIIVLTAAVTLFLFQKVDFAEFMNERLANSPNSAQMSPEQREMSIRVGKIIGQVSPPLVIALMFACGAALYLLGVMAMGKSITYKQALAVWIYSDFPPGIITAILSIIMLLIKPGDTIDLSRPGGGLLITNPSALLGPGASPVMLTLLASLDILRFYGLFLAALGLRKVARLSSGAAWAIVLSIWLLGIIFRLVGSLFSGGGM
jgi:hypothetical protein